jgi:tyrosyl-tRNA synthetase
MDDIEMMKKKVTDGENPMIFKKVLAKEIVSFYHGEEFAQHAQATWENTFQKNEIPTDLETILVRPETLLVDVFMGQKIVSSKGDFRRLVEENAITNLDTEEKVTSHTAIAASGVYRIGKKRFCKIEIK